MFIVKDKVKALGTGFLFVRWFCFALFLFFSNKNCNREKGLALTELNFAKTKGRKVSKG